MSKPVNGVNGNIPLDSFWFESGPPDIRVLLTDYLEEGNDMTEKEDQLLTALRDTYASRSELQGMRVEMLNKFSEMMTHIGEVVTHVKEGNGMPGLIQLNLRLDRIEQKIKPRERIRMQLVTATVMLIIGGLISWGMSAIRAKMFVEPIAKETREVKDTVNSDQSRFDAFEKKFDDYVKSQAKPVPASHRNPNRFAKPSRRQSLLRDGEVITTKEMPSLLFSSAHAPDFPTMRRP